MEQEITTASRSCSHQNWLVAFGSCWATKTTNISRDRARKDCCVLDSFTLAAALRPTMLRTEYHAQMGDALLSPERRPVKESNTTILGGASADIGLSFVAQQEP